jgi:GDPmannose 4,6-dehydratase
MLQRKKPKDYVIATGKPYTVKFFIEQCCKFLDLQIYWSGKHKNEAAYVRSFNPKKCPGLKIGSKIIEINKKYFRPNEVNYLKGDSSRAQKELGWRPKTNIYKLIKEMMTEDYKLLKKFI